MIDWELSVDREYLNKLRKTNNNCREWVCGNFLVGRNIFRHLAAAESGRQSKEIHPQPLRHQCWLTVDI